MTSSYPCGNRASCDVGVSDSERCHHFDECFPEEEDYYRERLEK